VTCSFDMRHYEELLEAAQSGGYTFRWFSEQPRPERGDLFLRHDVDLSLEAAVSMAELEAEMKVTANYFLMTQSVFYNLQSPAGERTAARLRELGHFVGLHAVWQGPFPPEYAGHELDAGLDTRFSGPVIAWHNPDPEYMSAPCEGVTNVMEPAQAGSIGHFHPDHYRSDSNQHWRSGCPHEALARGEFDWLQLLIHPEIWVYSGETMRETMLAFLDADREARLTHLAHDRIDLS
jgi:hypothetical protein